MKAIILEDSRINEKNGLENTQDDLTFTLKSINFDENYIPSNSTRTTTNFANLARGESRQENLRNAINMINNRFNSLANWDNPNNNRYSVELEIVSVVVPDLLIQLINTFSPFFKF